jgi:hypothetical protein
MLSYAVDVVITMSSCLHKTYQYVKDNTYRITWGCCLKCVRSWVRIPETLKLVFSALHIHLTSQPTRSEWVNLFAFAKSVIFQLYYKENKLLYSLMNLWWCLSWIFKVVIIAYTKWVIFQLYLGENKQHFDKMISTLYWTNMLSWIFVVLAHWNNSQWVDMHVPQ